MDARKKIAVFSTILIAVVIAVLGNSISAVWAQQTHWLSWWLLAVLLISPLVFITFGLVVERVGLAVGSGTIDSILTISTVLVGLIFFGEWAELSLLQYLGLASVLVGVVFLQFEERNDEKSDSSPVSAALSG